MSTIRATFVQHGSSPVPNITLNASGQVIVASGIVSSGTFAAPSGSVSAPGLYFVGDSNTGIYSPAADTIAFTEGGVESLRIDSAGRLGIGTTSPGSPLTIESNAGNQVKITYPSIASYYLNATSGGDFAINKDGTERARIDSSGRLLVGTSSARSNFSTGTPTTQYETATSSFNQGLSIINNGGSSAYFPILTLGTTKSTSVGSNTSIGSAGDGLGRVDFAGADGTNLLSGASITAVADGTWGTNDAPTRLAFSTTADGASSPTERMRIGSNGGVSMRTTGNYACVSNSSATAGTTATLFAGNCNASDLAGTGATTVYTVYSNGNVQNTNNSYGSLSDIKLKENIVNANSQWDDLKALQVRKYNFKEGQTHTQIGLIAQEVELVSPGLVSETPDRDEDGNDLGTVTKSVNYSVLYMKAVKALQEAMERIETLEAKVAALEGV